MERIESKLSTVQTECVRLDSEIDTIRKILFDQQLQIESQEKRLRAANIIVHNMPEDEITVSGEKLDNDSEKMSALCNMANIALEPDEMVVFQRLGKRQTNKTRPLKIQMKSPEQKFKLLNNRKKISNNDEIKHAFRNKVYVNVDSSFLLQKEEFRLRRELKELKANAPQTVAYIRSGALYSNGTIVDKIDIRNQFF